MTAVVLNSDEYDVDQVEAFFEDVHSNIADDDLENFREELSHLIRFLNSMSRLVDDRLDELESEEDEESDDADEEDEE